MAAGGEQEKVGGSGVGGDLYAVLGLKKECSATDLRSAYKKLALRWHPDRCSASGSSKSVDEAKTKFQAIQEAYSVLSDTSKRFLYDVGVYDNDANADDANGMGEFLGEMAAMMSQAKPNNGGSETFEELQELFVEMFQADMDAFCCGGRGATANTTTAAAASSRSQRWADGCDRASTSSTGCFYTTTATTTTTAASSYGSCRAAAGGGLKRDGDDMRSGRAKGVAAFDGGATFRFGTHNRNGSSTAAAAARGRPGGGGGRRRKPKASSRHRGPSSQEDGETPAG